MRVRRYKGDLFFQMPWNLGDPVRTRNVEVIIRDTDDSREVAFDFVEPDYVYNVFARKEGGTWSTRYKIYDEGIVWDSTLHEGMHIESFQVSMLVDSVTMNCVWVEDGMRYNMEYSGRIQSDEKIV